MFKTCPCSRRFIFKDTKTAFGHLSYQPVEFQSKAQWPFLAVVLSVYYSRAINRKIWCRTTKAAILNHLWAFFKKPCKLPFGCRLPAELFFNLSANSWKANQSKNLSEQVVWSVDETPLLEGSHKTTWLRVVICFGLFLQIVISH